MSKPAAADAKARLRAVEAAYIAQHSGPKCSTCLLPKDVLDAVREGRQRGTIYPILLAFLKAEGFESTRNRLHYHFENHEQHRKG